MLTRALLERIVIQTDGVPLFIEELTKTVLETSPGDTALSLPVPATLQASLMARLDRRPVGKQVAQIGAVIGREFSHALLAATAGLPEAQLAQGLDELVASGLATRRGVAPEAIYTFKHALVHDAVYESVLKGRRAEIHSAVVAAAERDTLLAIEPGIVGYHCAQAGLVAKAVNYYCLAGKQSAERAAAVETRVQLERGLQFVATLPGSPDHHYLEADLLLALADVLQLTKGFANLETEGVLARAIPLCRRLDDPQLLVRALEAQFAFVATRGDMASAHAAAQELLDGAEASGEPLMNALARMVMGCVLFWQGRFTSARKHLEASVALTARGPEVKWDSRADIYGRANLAPTLACLGYPEQAAEQVRLAIDWASRRGSFALAYSLSVAGRALVVLHDDVKLRERTLAQITLCEERGYLLQLAGARGALGWLEAKQGRVEQGLYLVRAGLAVLHKLGVAFSLPFLLGLEADVLVRAGHWSEALAALARALEVSHRTGEVWFNAELHRRRGELLLTGTQPDW